MERDDRSFAMIKSSFVVGVGVVVALCSLWGGIYANTVEQHVHCYGRVVRRTIQVTGGWVLGTQYTVLCYSLQTSTKVLEYSEYILLRTCLSHT
jgi:hypothetical protein